MLHKYDCIWVTIWMRINWKLKKILLSLSFNRSAFTSSLEIAGYHGDYGRCIKSDSIFYVLPIIFSLDFHESSAYHKRWHLGMSLMDHELRVNSSNCETKLLTWNSAAGYKYFILPISEQSLQVISYRVQICVHDLFSGIDLPNYAKSSIGQSAYCKPHTHTHTCTHIMINIMMSCL